jgi:ankyrin repeat protein
MVALLLEAEADVTIRSAIQAETMIEYAERKNNPEIVNLFNQFQNNR